MVTHGVARMIVLVNPFQAARLSAHCYRTRGFPAQGYPWCGSEGGDPAIHPPLGMDPWFSVPQLPVVWLVKECQRDYPVNFTDLRGPLLPFI
jgi:hypothetical protein